MEKEKTAIALTNLPTEILLLILEELNKTSRLSLRCLGATCHLFYKLSVPILYSHLRTNDVKFNRHIQAYLVPGSSLPQYLRKIEITSKGSEFQDHQQGQLHQLFQSLKNLDTFIWNGDGWVQQDLLDDVEYFFPKCYLSISLKIDEYRYNSTKCSHRSTLLNELVAYLDVLPPRRESHTKRYFRDVFKSSPNIKILARLPCDARTFHLITNPISETDIVIEDFPPNIRELYYFPLNFNALSYLSTNGLWKDLSVLKIEEACYLTAFAGHVPSLKYLTIWTTRDIITDKTPGLSDMGPLERLDLIGSIRYIPPLKALKGYALTLRDFRVYRLEYHKLSYDVTRFRRWLYLLSATLLKLERLHIDIPAMLWSISDLSFFSSLPRLTHLSLQFDLNLLYFGRDKLQVIRDIFGQITFSKEGIPLQYLYIHEDQVDLSSLSRDSNFPPTYTVFSYRDEIVVTTRSKQPKDHSDIILLHQIKLDIEAERSTRYWAGYLKALHIAISKYGNGNGHYWIAKRVDSEWAKSLVFNELITAEQAEIEDQDPSFSSIENRYYITQDGLFTNEIKRITHYDLQRRKWRRAHDEIYGRYCTLYDVLYSKRDY